MRCRSLTTRLVLLGLLAPAGPALASPFYAPPPLEEDAPVFSGDTELGYTQLSGNTNSQTLIAKLRLAWQTGDWAHHLRSEARNASSNDETSTEQYLLAARERRDLEGPHYLFGFARWEKERFSGYDQQLTAIAGYGRHLFDEEDLQLSLEAGPGYRRDAVDGGERRSLAVAYGAMDYRWAFSEVGSLGQELSVEATDDNTTLRSLSALTARLNASLALRLSVEFKHNTRPPEDAEALTDRTTSASLLYSW